jgi:anti-sigma B factor antagonist
MNIEQDIIDKSTVMLALTGRLDTASAPLLERKIKQWGDDIVELILDFSGLTYISSMGLRVLLQAHKAMKEKGRKLVIKNMCDSVREVFEMTGFLSLMVHEERFVAIRKDEPCGIVLSLNGQMKCDNIPAVAKELSEIMKANCIREEPATVILDMENLASISPGAGKLLKQAIADTAWEKRNFAIRNASGDALAELENEGMGELIR